MAERPPIPYETRPVVADDAGWIAVRATGHHVGLPLPDVCCSCLSETHRRAHVETATTYRIWVPLCAACAARWRRWRTRFRIAWFSAAGLGLLAYALVSRFAEPAFLFQLCAVVGMGSAGACALILDRFGHPVRTSTAWRFRFGPDAMVRFRNPDYLKHLRPPPAGGTADERE
jgi:hypothetical protein